MGIRSLLSKAVVAFFLGAAKAKLLKAKNTTKKDLMFHSIDTTFSLRIFTGILCSNCHSVCSPWVSSTNWFCSCARVSTARRVHGSHSSSGAILAPCSPQTPLLTGFALRKLKIFWDGGGRRIGALHWANLHLFFSSSLVKHDLYKILWQVNTGLSALCWLRHRFHPFKGWYNTTIFLDPWNLYQG